MPISLKWRVTYRIGVHSIADSFSCQCHVSTKAIRYGVNSAPSSLHKLRLLEVCDSRFSDVYQAKLPHFSLSTFSMNETHTSILSEC